MAEYRLTEAGRIGLRMLLDAETLYPADRRGLHLLGMDDVVDLPDEWVEPVPPPLPPEPEPGVYLIGAHLVARAGWDIGRDPWRYLGPGLEGDTRGASTFAGDQEWADLWSALGGTNVTIRRLVPAPEPVTLPWHGRSDLGRELIVAPPVPESRYQLVPLAVNGTATTVAPGVARAMAAALLSAAEQAEGTSP